MKTKILIAILVSFLVISAVAAGMIIPANDKAEEIAANDKAEEKAQGDSVSTPPGLEKMPPGLEKIVFIHYKKGHGRPADKPGKPGGKPDKGPKCYDFFGKGIKWKELPVSYVVHPDLEACSETSLMAILSSAETWDDASSEELFSDEYAVSDTANWDSDAPDGRNELAFGDYPEEGVIAVAVVWGYFSGPPWSRKIIEFDILFDTDFAWGDADGDPSVMDLQNIATHELGHGVGLGDLYDTRCSEVTMYGYSSYGETKKRDLEPADITGIQELYGE